MSIVYSTAFIPPLPVLPACEIRLIPTFPGYAITNTGQVWSMRLHGYWKQKKISTGEKSRRRVHLRHNGTYTTKSIAHLLLEAFVGPCPPGQEARHLNDDPSEDALHNIAWGTHAENMFDIHRNGTRYNKGESNGYAKLYKCEAEEIYKLVMLKIRHRIIGKMFNVDTSVVTRIGKKQAWRSIHE